MAARDVNATPAGLWTAASSLDAPKGGLAQANNVVIRRKGIAQPRPGFSEATAANVASVFRMIYYNGEAVNIEGTSKTACTGGVVKKVDGTDVAWAADSIKGVESRKNLYMTTADGLRKMTSVSAVVAPLACAPRPTVAPGGGSSTLPILATSDQVAYRVVCMRRDDNLVVTRSAPSGRMVYISPGARAPQLVIGLPSIQDWAAGDTIEIYRSVIFPGTTPDDELYLAGQYVLTATDISNKYATYTDRAADASLTTALYTNDSQGGIEAANETPPLAKCAAMFNGSLFLGNLTYPQALQLSWAAGAKSTLATGVGTRSIACTLVNGSASVTVGLATGLEVGMALIIPSQATGFGSYAALALVTAIVGTTVTMDTVWGGTSTTVTGVFADTIRISSSGGTGGVYYPVVTAGELATRNNMPTSAFAEATMGPSAASGWCVAVALSDSYTDGVGNWYEEDGYASVLFRGATSAGAGFRISATHGTDYTPALPAHADSSKGLLSSQETIPNGLAWSKNLEPEHFALANADFAGPTGSILDIVANENALIVFKTTGTWRVSGSGAESGFRFDELDPMVRLLSPYAAARLGAAVYAWGDTGVFECTENACTEISSPAIYNLLEPVQAYLKNNETTNYGAWIVAGRLHKEIYVGVPSTSDRSKAALVYVFNTAQGAWTTWFSGETATGCALYMEDSAQLYFVYNGTTTIRQERDIADAYYTADKQYSVTTTARTGAAITITALGYTPVAGDLVKSSAGDFYLIDSVTDATHFTLNEAPGNDITLLWVAPTATLAPLGGIGTSPGDLKVWGEGCLWWKTLLGMCKYATSFTSSTSTTSVSQTKDISTARVAYTGGDSIRFTAPLMHARSTYLYPAVTIRQGGSKWELQGFDLGFYRASDRVRVSRK